MKQRFQKALQDKDFSELFKKGGSSFLIRTGGQVFPRVPSDYSLLILILSTQENALLVGMEQTSSPDDLFRKIKRDELGLHGHFQNSTPGGPHVTTREVRKKTIT